MPSEIYKTCLEKQMYGYLIELGYIKGVDFYEQYPFGCYSLDFAFVKSRKPFRGLNIETDGVIFHSSEQQQKRDNYRNYKLLKGGWITERFRESFTIEQVEAILAKHGIKPSP